MRPALGFGASSAIDKGTPTTAQRRAMSTEDSTRRSYRTKKRKVTACNECHRRKQKCNRQKPCNYCIDRGVTNKCVYRSYSEGGRSVSPPPTDFEDSPRDVRDDDTAQSLSYALGYARDAPDETTTAGPGGTPMSSSHGPEMRKLVSLLQKLPAAATTQTLVSIFFSEANWYFTVLDRHHFDLDHRQWVSHRESNSQHTSPDVLCFPALLFQVLAAACQFVPRHLSVTILRATEARSLDELGTLLSDTGEKYLGVLGRHLLAITAVEADLMRCAWLKNCGRGTEAWYSLANSVRQAQDQRLHQEPHLSTDLSSQWQAEHRRRLWATIFTWEAHMALQLGRARMINLADCTVRCPLDCDMPDVPSRTLLATSGPYDAPSHFTSAIVKYRISCMIHELMNVGAFRPAEVHYPDVVKAHSKVEHLLTNLPPAVRPLDPDTSWDLRYPELVRHRLQIGIITHSFLLSLHRPHTSQYPESLAAATAAANTVLSKSQTLFDITEPHHYKTHTNTFYTIDTAMLLSAIVATLSLDHPQRGPSLLSIRQAIRRLGVLKSRNPAAVAGERALAKFLDRLADNSSSSSRRLPPSDDDPVEASPQHVRPMSFGNTNSPLSTDPLQTMQSLLGDGPDARVPAAAVSAPPAVAVPQSFSASDQTSPFDSEIFAQIMSDSAYTANWLESTSTWASTHCFSPGISLGSFTGSSSDWTGTTPL